MNSQTGRPSPDHHHEDPTTAERSLHPLDNVLSSTSNTGAILEMRTGLHEMGRNRSLHSGATDPVADDLRSLEEHARAIARDTYRDLYDPEKNANDRMHHLEYKRLLDLREGNERGVAHATANVHESEMVLAVTPKAGLKPEASTWLVAAFVVTITLTVAPTLHDFLFFGIQDDLLAWFASSLCAAFVASMLTLAILSGRRTRWTWVGVIAGIVLGIGLCALRISSAQGTAEVLFALGLTIVEVSAVLLLEWLASGLRTREEEWRALKLVEDKATECRDAMLVDLERRKKQLHEVNEAIERKINYVEDRTHRNVHLPELEAVAVKAVVDGYYAGIAENVGRLVGARPRRVL